MFFSDTAISKNVHAAVAKGQLRKIGSQLYTRNLTEDPEKIVRRNWYGLVADYFHDAVIADRTALENKPAEDGSIFLISAKTREVAFPGIFLRPRTGPAPLESDRPLSGARLASTARAYLENMRLPAREVGEHNVLCHAKMSKNGSTRNYADRMRPPSTAFATMRAGSRPSLAMTPNSLNSTA